MSVVRLVATSVKVEYYTKESVLTYSKMGLGHKFEWSKVRVNKYFAQIIVLFVLINE